MKKLIIFCVSLLVLLAGVVTISTQKADATVVSKVTLCHKQVWPHITIEVALSAVPAHLAHGDSIGACVSVTPTVTVTPSPTITVSPTPSCEGGEVYSIRQICPTEEPTPTPTVEVTPTPTEKVESGGGSAPTFAGSSTEAPQCGDTKPGKVANINVVSTGERGVLVVQWALPSGADKAHIEYGLEKEPQHSLLETPNDGNEVIHELNSGQHYWFRVAGVNGCAVGDWSDWYDPIAP